MANLYNRKAVHPAWATWALPVLDSFANSTIAIFEPNGETNGDNYNPFTKRVTSKPTLLWQGQGQIAVFRQTLYADDVAGSVTQVRSVRFTVPLDGPDLPVRKGLIVRVIECKHDPDAELYEYTVTSGINGDLSWKRTIEAESDMGVIVSPITDYNPIVP